jgi:hypothetical protein
VNVLYRRYVTWFIERILVSIWFKTFYWLLMFFPCLCNLKEFSKKPKFSSFNNVSCKHWFGWICTSWVHKLRTTLLQQGRVSVERLLEPFKTTWPTKGITITFIPKGSNSHSAWVEQSGVIGVYCGVEHRANVAFGLTISFLLSFTLLFFSFLKLL